MPDRITMTRLLLILYAMGSVVVAMRLLFAIGAVGQLANTTSGKVLVAALLALAFGAAVAARDPWRGRLMIQVVMAFTTLSALAIAYRLGFEHYGQDPAWLLLPFAVAVPLLLGLFYPRRPGD